MTSISRLFRPTGQGLKSGIVAVLALCFFSLQANAATPPPPQIAAKGYVLMDFNSGQIIANKNADERLEPASLTKMMTAYIVLDELARGKINLTDDVLISEKAWRMPGSRTFVEVDTKVSVETLLKGMIIQSGNDASVALAEYIGGGEDVFATMMNQIADKLGMKSSHFQNATGLPHPEHYTTATDMAILARALIHDFPEHYSWYSIKQYSYNGITQYNRNKLLWRDDSVDGLKTGHTEAAGYCLVASAKRDDMRLVSVVLGTKSEDARAVESQKLLSYGFRFFESHQLYGLAESLAEVKVWKGETDALSLGIARTINIVIPRGEYDNLKAEMNIEPTITAPVNKGDTLGNVVVRLGDETVAQAPLVALKDIPEAGIVQSLMDEIMLMFE